MSLSSGTKLGPYEITGQLGAGGMGEVCGARDTKLNRDVALQVLQESFVADCRAEPVRSCRTNHLRKPEVAFAPFALSWPPAF